MTTKNLSIKPSEHVLISGTTGSGKSYFAENYLSHYKHVVKLDTKNEYEERINEGKSAWAGLRQGIDFEVVNHLVDIQYVDTPKIIYAPVFEELEEEYYDEFFRFCFERQNNIVWVDELLSVVSNQRMTPNHKRIMTQGRSKNVGCWNCTQRPSGIPMLIPTNTTHYITYYLNWLEDRKKMYAYTGCEDLLISPRKEKYEFWYCKAGSSKAVKGKLKIVKGGGNDG